MNAAGHPQNLRLSVLVHVPCQAKRTRTRADRRGSIYGIQCNEPGLIILSTRSFLSVLVRSRPRPIVRQGHR